MRYQVLIGGADLNLEVNAGGGEERTVLLEDLVLNYALSIPRPDKTWQNTRGAQSRLDYVLYRAPQPQLHDDMVLEGPEEVLKSDHRPIHDVQPEWSHPEIRKKT